ncbi:AMP-binding protein [Janthinobacterium sp.]|uniref:AMP-binding protein n=1 Tax=Janthinobacterium sp. TaxID=1871054 RepID=UPI00293D7EE3|nr:AMP-binding protein [Janthinobacterium sp.]
MSDSLNLLAARLAARGPDFIVGWRAGAAVRNDAFGARARAWAALLRRRPGRHYALYLEDSVEFAAALLGAWQAGKTVWLSADTLAASCAALAASVDGFLGEFPAALAPLAPAPGDGDDEGAPLALDADGAALVVHTSGSTGAAQAVPKRLAQLASEVTALESLFGAQLGDAAIVATVSHQHIYGLLFKVLWPLAAGRAIVAHSVSFSEQLALLLAERPCALVASPAHLKRLPAHLDWRAGAAQLRAVFSSGGPLAPDDARATGAMLGRVPAEVYGSSETGGIAWRRRDAGSDESWLAFPNVDWRVAEAEGALEVRSPHLADAGWLRLADRVRAAGEGRFQLLGRSDRIVKIEEKRISLDGVEAALAASPLVAEARVLLCAPAPGRRQTLAAFVVLSAAGRAALDGAGKAALNARLRAALGGAVDAVALPRRWRYLERLPVNAQGKTTQAMLLALLDEARPLRPHLRLLERAAERVLLEISVPANLLYLDGHFSEAPILPGVVQVDWAIAYGREYFALPARFLAIHALKFQHVVRPDAPLRLELLHDAAKGSLTFRYLSDSGQHASGRILFGAADDTPTAKTAC